MDDLFEEPEQAIILRDVTDSTLAHDTRPRAGDWVRIIWIDSTGTALVETTGYSSTMRMFLPEDNLQKVERVNG